ncbi:MAG: DNA-directed RNA polymerase subunit D [Candidatus Woesearchaeota archaeon]|nr:MAG: DNA-directed RNA polymerase subunit D [Candidatus Woesearchaeota archaeon]
MEIKFLDKTNGTARFLLEEADEVTANTMRRLILEEVPTLAVEDCTIHKNDSALYDEMIAQRLGLIPLKTDLKSYVLPENCKCKGEGCARCQLNLSLKVKGPCIVYSGEIKSQDPKVTPVYDKIPIVKLLKGQKLEVDMVATLGKGKVHSKWSPALAYYRYYPEIKLSNVKDAEKAKNICPKHVFEVKGSKLEIKDLEACDLCMLCTEYGVEVKGNPKNILFFLEPWGQLKEKEILTEALEILNEKLKDLDKGIS